jgi:beta-phosphoglucomutase
MRQTGLIFDFNGVLWWDGPLQTQAWRDFSQALRGAALAAEEMDAHVHGRHNRHTLSYLLGRPVHGDELQRLSAQKETIYRQLCLAQGDAFRLSPGAAALLDFLVEQAIPRTIATASGPENLAFFIRHLDLARWFDLDAIVYDDGLLPGKPAPDCYLQAARNLGLPPARCIVVEDSRAGIQAAHAAGIGRLVALGPPATHAALRQLPGVTHVIASLADFPRAELFSSPAVTLK